MFERIVVPLDGTQVSEQALGPAVSVAREDGAHVHLVTVEEAAAAQHEPLVGVLDSDYLEGIAARVRDAGVSSVSRTCIVGHKVPDALEAYRKEVGADLIVMCTHGRGGRQRVLLGSVADELVRSSEAPVLLVRAASNGGAHGDDLHAAARFKRVLVALDGTHFSRQALEAASRLGGKTDTVYILAHVMTGSAGLGDEPWPKEQALAEAKMDLEVQSFAALGHSVESALSSSPSASQGLLDVAARRNAEVVVIATHGRSGIGRLVLGSVADEVIRHADLPILVVRPRDA